MCIILTTKTSKHIRLLQRYPSSHDFPIFIQIHQKAENLSHNHTSDRLYQNTTLVLGTLKTEETSLKSPVPPPPLTISCRTCTLNTYRAAPHILIKQPRPDQSPPPVPKKATSAFHIKTMYAYGDRFRSSWHVTISEPPLYVNATGPPVDPVKISRMP